MKKKILITLLALCLLMSFVSINVLGRGKIKGTIRLLCWPGYEFKDAYATFCKKYGVTIQPTFITNNDDIFAKLKAGDEYDIVTPIQANIHQLVVSNLLQPIDLRKISNYKYLNPEIAKIYKAFHYNGKAWGVPIDFGKNDIIYNAVKYKNGIQSRWDFLKPEWKGRYALMDDAIGNITEGARAIGKTKDVSLLTPDEFAKVKDYLIKLKRNARAILNSYADVESMLMSGEIDAWVGAGNILVIGEMKRKGNNDFWANIPKEGTLVFIDSYCIPKNAPNPEGAYALCNELLSTKVQLACASNYWGVVTTNALPLLTAEQKRLYPYDNLPNFFTQNELNGPAPLVHGKYMSMSEWIQMWEEVKATQ